ncbi:MAG: LysE family translocator [Chloroflexi bacterium]|uniref:LysE family translocator n=1 Tax=Candidatus Chlorohelix allophototropha TaxID=3003348 RepID=A0A8T7M556_9CHLR|nr:LysE family translocator [Chloroflexota bacterium]WJW69165.1 LysE family translocator [Chloroflexota bacterium L227-S17]
MPEFTTLLAFSFASFVLAITPGPAMILIISSTVSQNFKAGLVTAISSGLGLYLHAVAVAFGLSALLLAVPVAFDIIKIAGALYLIYLGLQTILSKAALLDVEDENRVDASSKSLIYQGLTAAVLNPKVALFFMAFLPQFVRPERGEVTGQILFLGIIFTLVVTLVGLGIALAASYAAALLKRNRNVVKVQNWVFGSVFIAFGAQLFFAEHK